MAELFNFAREITNRYGAVKRARDCYLYTVDGTRLTDLCQEQGRAILGWGGGKAKQVFKNVLDRGLTGSYDSKYLHYATEALKKLMPEYAHFRVYSCADRLREAFCRYFDLWVYLPLSENPVVNQVMTVGMTQIDELTVDDWLFVHGIPVWRPWVEDAWYMLEKKPLASFLQKHENTRDAIAVIPPFPWVKPCYIAAFSDKHIERILPSEPIAPPILAAIGRSLHDLFDEIPKRSERDWNRYDDIILRYWKRRGPYLIPQVPKEKYMDFFLHCLDNKIVISPEYLIPSIIPYGAFSGDFNHLRKNLFVF